MLERLRPQPAHRAPSVPGVRDLEPLAAGRFSTILIGRETAPSARQVVVKVLTAPVTDAAVRARFEEDRAALAVLEWHPQIASFLRSGVLRGRRCYLVMPFYPSQSLGMLLGQRGVLPVADVLRIGIRLSGALAAMHGLTVPVLHRDVRPGNVLMIGGEIPVLTNSGVARLTESAWSRRTAPIPDHTPPEIVDARGPVLAAGDVYGLASTMYELLSGTAPLVTTHDESREQHSWRIRHEAPPALSRGDIPASMDALLMAALAKDPAERPTAAAFAAALLAVQAELGLAPTPPATRLAGLLPPLPQAVRPPVPRWVPAAAAPVLAIAAAVALGFLLRPSQRPAISAQAAVPVASVVVASPPVVAPPTPSAVPSAADPMPPTGVALSRVDPTALRLNWAPQTEAGVSYLVVFNAPGAGAARTLPLPGSATQVNLPAVARPGRVFCALVEAVVTSSGLHRDSAPSCHS
jgi:serine/threonine-protein kinase PknK